uniref:hypothetical protein n=1 Tax=Ascoseira mirabilis TaxID=76830 RepID=UPI003001968E|nr:hypothetical protein ASMI159 [Ascoseira mirabilis]
MTFWDNFLRYLRFFPSSMIGLVLIILTPIFNKLKNFNDKKIIYLFVMCNIMTLFYILKEMISID